MVYPTGGELPVTGGMQAPARELPTAIFGDGRIQTVNEKSQIAHFQGPFQLRACHIVVTQKYLWNQHMDDLATRPGPQYPPGQTNKHPLLCQLGGILPSLLTSWGCYKHQMTEFYVVKIRLMDMAFALKEKHKTPGKGRAVFYSQPRNGSLTANVSFSS